MPWGLTRFQQSGQSHFVTFWLALERVRRRCRLSVYGYVVMPEHVHLLLSELQTAPLKPKAGLNGPSVPASCSSTRLKKSNRQNHDYQYRDDFSDRSQRHRKFSLTLL